MYGAEGFGGVLCLRPAIDVRKYDALTGSNTHVAPEISGVLASAMVRGLVVLVLLSR